MVGEAKDCFQTWTCEGGKKCRDKCMAEYKGIGRCDEITAPIVPPQWKTHLKNRTITKVVFFKTRSDWNCKIIG
ncbi:hypothetical protein YC2023_063273 [Brassica napus]